jgi:hypothetical protein
MTNLHHNFNDLAKKKTKREAPFSLRLTFEERAALEAAAGDMPLGAYIKAVLFGQDLQKVRQRSKTPVKDHEALGRVLAALGQSRLANNLNQLARAVNTGTLPVHPETEADLRSACDDVAVLRAMLLEALGKAGGPA